MKTAQERKVDNKPDGDKLSRIDAKMQAAVKHGESYVYLYFDQFGYEWEDVNFLSELYGYKVSRNGPCLWWEVSW